MTTISNQKEFVEWLSKSDKDFELKRYNKSCYTPHDRGMVKLKNLVLENKTFDSRQLECTLFNHVTFENCGFDFTIFSSCTLKDCNFNNCRFTWSKFLDVDLYGCNFNECVITGLEISDADMNDTKFVNCREILDLSIRGARERTVTFLNCYLHYIDIEPNRGLKEEFYFNDCLIKESSFDRIDFLKSSFDNCNLSLNQFSACVINENTFKQNNETPGNEYNLIDIRTILNSATIDKNLLENLFGITNSEVKEYLVGLTTKIKFQSIFISYCFEDKEFANRINEELKQKGILTFLWEKDSPGGKQLKHIMSSGIQEKDRLLFIASKNSLKSKACQFELSEGRKKQESIWEDVLIPIHIDNYLFEIKKDKIRPIEIQTEYWQNITELKMLNSLDFSPFIDCKKYNEIEFEKMVYRLIKGLRKTK